jgi:hypothetical protein
MKKFKIEITSVPDRSNLVAEIWYEESLLAEINQEEEILKVELYNTQKEFFIYEDFIAVFEEAKQKLLRLK